MIEKEEAEKLNNLKNIGSPYLKFLCPDCKISVDLLAIEMNNELHKKGGMFAKAKQTLFAAKMMQKVQGLICNNCKAKLLKEHLKTRRGGV